MSCCGASTANNGGTDAAKPIDCRLKAYLVGQCANACKIAVWWTAFTPLVFALLHQDSAVGSMRLAFNITMALLSPIAGVFAERAAVRKMLSYTTMGRFVVWAVLLPAAYAGASYSSISYHAALATLYAALVVMSLLDGACVAFSNVVDIDMGGLDMLALQHHIPITDKTRNFFNSVHTIAFDASMIALAPAMAFLSRYLSHVIRTDAPDADDKSELGTLEAGGIVAVFAGVFLVASIVSLVCYLKYIPSRKIYKGMDFGGKKDESKNGDANGNGAAAGDAQQPSSEGPKADDGTKRSYSPPPLALEDTAGDGAGGGDAAGAAAAAAPAADDEKVGLCMSFPMLLGLIRDGVKVVWRNKPILWRLVFMAFEVALEDAMVAVMIAEYCLSSKLFGAEDPVQANLWTALVVAVGKVGAVLAGSYMHRCWTPPARVRGYTPLFLSVMLGGAATFLLPVAHYLSKETFDPTNDDNYRTLSKALVFCASFLFFVFSTGPKIGFGTLLQGMAAKVQQPGRIFGFVGTFITAVDAVVIVAMTLVFGRFKAGCNYIKVPYVTEAGAPSFTTCTESKLHDREQTEAGHECDDCLWRRFGHALWACCAIYAAHGLFEALCGPWLVREADVVGAAEDGGGANGETVAIAIGREDVNAPLLDSGGGGGGGYGSVNSDGRSPMLSPSLRSPMLSPFLRGGSTASPALKSPEMERGLRARLREQERADAERRAGGNRARSDSH